MKKIQFTVNFGNNKKGDVLNVDVVLASRLVKIRNVAVYYQEPIIDETPEPIEAVVEPIIDETPEPIEAVVEPIIDETPEIVVKKTKNVNN